MVHYHYSLSLFIIIIYLLFIIVEEANNEFRSFSPRAKLVAAATESSYMYTLLVVEAKRPRDWSAWARSTIVASGTGANVELAGPLSPPASE